MMWHVESQFPSDPSRMRREGEPCFREVHIWQMAEQIEYESCQFYLESAELSTDLEVQRLCYELVSWKARHAMRYAQMRRQSTDETQWPVRKDDGYLNSHPRVMTGLVGLFDRQRRDWAPRGYDDHRIFLDVAVARAKDAFAFYQGLSEFAADADARGAICSIMNTQHRFLMFLIKLRRHAELALAASTGL